jgi:S-DNA-T family DNA segregation ATPase FtsK/SpoIIIE
MKDEHLYSPDKGDKPTDNIRSYNSDYDLSGHMYPTTDLLPVELISVFEQVGKGSDSFQIPLLLNGGEKPIIKDMYQYPNTLIAGTIASGKTQFIYNQLVVWLYIKHPAEIKFMICRSKPIDYNSIARLEKHFIAQVGGSNNTLVDPNEFVGAISILITECKTRLSLFAKAEVKNILDYNELFIDGKLDIKDGHRFLPNIVLIIDDLFNFMNTKEDTDLLIQLTQQNLYTGIYTIAATSQINSRLLSSQLRANFSLRISMKLMSQSESRRILDKAGAERLIDPGEILYSERNNIKQGQQPYIPYPTIQSVCEHIASQKGYPTAYLLTEYPNILVNESYVFNFYERDSLFEEAARLIVAHQQGSPSLIQRRMKLGYNRAGRIIDQLEAAGILGPFEGSKAREVLYPDEYSLEQFLEVLKNGTPSQIKKRVRPKEKDKTNEATNPNISPSEKTVSKGEVSMIDEPRTIVDEQPVVEYPKKKRDYTLFYILTAIVILLLVVYFI